MDKVPTYHMHVELGHVTYFANRMLVDVTQVETKNVIAWFHLASCAPVIARQEHAPGTHCSFTAT